MKKYLILFLLIFLSCKNERDFEWSEDLKQTVGSDLKDWIKKSPFDGKWNYKESKTGRITVDNRNLVFPFMGKFKNSNDNFKGYHNSEGHIYQKEVILFKDSEFGESFVYSALLYEAEELYLQASYSEMGNFIISGLNDLNVKHNAKLLETEIINNNSEYKTAIYWVKTDYKKYLFGFYQKGKLVFQFGFPCDEDNKSQGLERIKQINQNLNLNIEEWSNATIKELEMKHSSKSFWKNPFIGIYIGEYMLPEVKVKIRNTKFKELKSGASNEKGVDYIFAHQELNSQISFKKEETSLTEKQYEAELGEQKQILTNDHISSKLFINKEKTNNGKVTMDTETYLKDNSILKAQISYPKNNSKAKDQMFDILRNLKIRKF